MVEAPLYIDDTAGINLMDMHAKLRRLQQSGQKLGLVIVDYLQLMSSRGPLREPQPGSQPDLARHEAAGEGTQLSRCWCSRS